MNFLQRPILLVLVGWLAFIQAGETAASQIDTSAYIKDVDTLIESKVGADEPGIAVSIVLNGKPVYEKYVGLANLSDDIPFSSNSKSNIASNAKQYVAAMVLDLFENKQLSLDTEFRIFTPQLLPYIEDDISVRQLINHSSGIRDLYDLMSVQGKTWWRQEGLDNDDGLDLLNNQRKLSFALGSQHIYSNSNYIILVAIVEQISGQTFADYSSAFFKRLGMLNSRFVTNYMNVIPHKARPYGFWGSWKEYPSIASIHGDGNLYSNLQDQLIWESIVQSGSHAFLSEQVITQFRQAFSGSDITEYGAGVSFAQYKGLNYSLHNGETGAYRANFVRFLPYGLSVVVISNNGQVYAQGLALEIVDVLLAKHYPKLPINPTRPQSIGNGINIADYLGHYEADNGDVIRFIENNGQLAWRRRQNRPFVFSQEQGNLYQMAENNEVKVAFTAEGSSKIMTLFHPSIQPRRYARYPLISSDDPALNHFQGNFYNDELDISLRINYAGSKEFILTSSMSDKTRKVTMIKPYQLSWRGFTLRPDSVNKGKVGRLYLDSDRAKNIEFVRVAE